MITDDRNGVAIAILVVLAGLNILLAHVLQPRPVPRVQQ